MTADNEIHLDESQLLRSIVDEAELPTSVREHLSACHRCRAGKERIEKSLMQLASMAVRFTPAAPERTCWNPERVSRRWRLQWDWRFVRAGGLAVAAVCLLVLGSSLYFGTFPERAMVMLDQESANDAGLVADVNKLSENALPRLCLEICEESDGGLRDDFIEFVAPSPGRDLSSEAEGYTIC